MFENKYPYTDFHEMNLDWFLHEFCGINDKVNAIDEKIQKALEEYFDKIMLNALYDAETETIILSKELIVNSDLHVYNAENTAVEVG